MVLNYPYKQSLVLHPQEAAHPIPLKYLLDVQQQAGPLSQYPYEIAERRAARYLWASLMRQIDAPDPPSEKPSAPISTHFPRLVLNLKVFRFDLIHHPPASQAACA
jgi:hypothetical protein